MGKGDNYRPVDTEKYEINWNFIYNPPKCELCGKPLRQWMVGLATGYCVNKECNNYLEKIERETK